MERRLAAILAGDVVGYARLMGEDEAGTLARLRALRAEAADPVASRLHDRTGVCGAPEYALTARKGHWPGC